MEIASPSGDLLDPMDELDDESDGSLDGDDPEDPPGEDDPADADQESDEGDDDDDSDTETQRIGSSVLRFASRCVKSGEFSKAMAALMKVVEISDLSSVPCRQALLFAAQILCITGQVDKALTCVMELWPRMPPPYSSQDAQLFMALLYDRLEQPRVAVFWYEKMLGTSYPSHPSAMLNAWLPLAHKAYDHGDLILSAEAFAHAFSYLLKTRKWPTDKDEKDGFSVFRFVGRFLTALTSVAHLRLDREMHRQEIAFALTMLLSSEIEASPMAQRVHHLDYLLVRQVYFGWFPSLYDLLFREEDWFIGRISRAWRVYQARQARRRAIEERELDREQERIQAVAAAVTVKKQKKPRKKPTKIPATTPSLRSEEDAKIEAIRCKTKARIESLRRSPPNKIWTSATLATATAPMSCSPTRRKLEAVKKMRKTPPLEEPATASVMTTTTTTDERPTSSGSEKCTSLLDVYTFPPLAARREQFSLDALRPQGAADVDNDLEEIEAFARMAHYRSRVLQQQQTQDVSKLSLSQVSPEWLTRFNEVLTFIQGHHDQRQQQQQHHHRSFKRYFSEIHARVLFQLTRIHTKYVLQHGKTMFTIQLHRFITKLENWQFTNIQDDVLRGLYDVKQTGVQEEVHHNLEFFHVVRLQNS